VSIASVVGTHAQGAFVRHVGLLNVDPAVTLNSGDAVYVYHMAPPPGVAALNVHVAAWVEDLRHGEAQLIELEAEHLVTLGGSYSVNPLAGVKRDPVTQMVQRYQ
jgi:hypothetical protein